MSDATAVSGSDIVNDAATWVSQAVPYLWGGITRAGADCSGFVLAVFAEQGITISGRDTEQQVQDGTAVPIGPAGSELEFAQPGDVIFFGLNNPSLENQHEGIYIGNGQMIDEPHTGAHAEVDDVMGWSASGEPLSAIRSFVPGTDANGQAALAAGGISLDAAGSTSPTASTSSSSSSKLGTDIINGVATVLFFGAGVLLCGLGAWQLANPGKKLSTQLSKAGSQ